MCSIRCYFHLPRNIQRQEKTDKWVMFFVVCLCLNIHWGCWFTIYLTSVKNSFVKAEKTSKFRSFIKRSSEPLLNFQLSQKVYKGITDRSGYEWFWMKALSRYLKGKMLMSHICNWHPEYLIHIWFDQLVLSKDFTTWARLVKVERYILERNKCS